MSAYRIGDTIQLAGDLEPGSIDLILSSPPFLAVRSYLPADHPDKGKEGGQQATPGEYLDWLLDVVEALAPALAPHGSLVFELGDTYAGSGGAGGDYSPEGMRAGQPLWEGSQRKDARVWDGAGPPIPDRRSQPMPGGPGWPRAKSKSLIPELFRIALAYGSNPLTGRPTPPWIVRNVITWCRPNPTPGALGDKVRPATSDIVCATRSGKRWFDLDSERTAHSRPPELRPDWNHVSQDTGSRGDDGKQYSNMGNPAGAPLLDWWELPPEQPAEEYGRTGGRTAGTKGPNMDRGDQGRGNFGNAGNPPLLDWWELPPEQPVDRQAENARRREHGIAHGKQVDDRGDGGASTSFLTDPNGPPPLDFWVLPPGGYDGAHYAVWPPELVRRLINLMCPRQVCRTCGEPRRRIVGKKPEYEAFRTSKLNLEKQTAPPQTAARHAYRGHGSMDYRDDEGARGQLYETLGWTDCGHDNWRDGMVLDPFAGSGTTLMVADGMGRDSLGFDLDERNLALAHQRCGMFLQ